MRAADLGVSLQWLYEHTREQSLLDTTGRAKEQAYEWRAHSGQLEPRRIRQSPCARRPERFHQEIDFFNGLLSCSLQVSCCAA